MFNIFFLHNSLVLATCYYL